MGNGGSFLAGAVALFNGTEQLRHRPQRSLWQLLHRVRRRDQPLRPSNGGSITNNRIYFNAAYDEGGAVLIAGELPAVFDRTDPGLGRRHDRRQPYPGQPLERRRWRSPLPDGVGRWHDQQLAHDRDEQHHRQQRFRRTKGRWCRHRRHPQRPTSWTTRSCRNITTATAVTSDGPSGPGRPVHRSEQRALLQSKLPSGSLAWSKPNLVNNIFADNRAGSCMLTGITGIGKAGDPYSHRYVGHGHDRRGPRPTPTYSILQSTPVAPACCAGEVPTHRREQTNSSPASTLSASTGSLRPASTPKGCGPTRTSGWPRCWSLDTPVTQMGDYHLGTRLARHQHGRSASGRHAQPGDSGSRHRPRIPSQPSRQGR